MKKTILYLLCILISTMMICVLPVSGEEEIYDNVIRLHILANSDSAEDQTLKLELRDYIVSSYSSDLSKLKNREEAEEKVKSILREIENDSESFVRSKGYVYKVKVSLSEEFYPTREYENCSFPAGKYLSLRIVIGNGEGQNWWCVLFPPLCTEIATQQITDYSDVSAGLTKEQYNLISETDNDRYIVKFKILEALESSFK